MLLLQNVASWCGMLVARCISLPQIILEVQDAHLTFILPFISTLIFVVKRVQQKLLIDIIINID